MKNYLKNQVIYQVFTRNYTKEGTFKALINKLDYIKSLKTDILYLLPINPIGKINRKGDLGSPYSISNYLEINRELGTLDDFKELIKETHSRNMKLIIDIVFNHTSRDSWILKNHPEWMYKNSKGEFANKAGDWSDVYDLDTKNPELIKYLVGVIEFYSSLGVDGYRFDVASLISKDFFIELNKMLKEKYPDTILLAESTHIAFIKYCREKGFNSLSDEELYNIGFDLLYPYNSIEAFQTYCNAPSDITSLIEYKTELYVEETMSNKDALRIRCLENHDQKRICEYTKLNENFYYTLLAYPAFKKGPLFIYNGLESKSDHVLSLFTKDLLDLSIDESWKKYLERIIEYKKDPKNLDLLTSFPLIDDSKSLIIKNTFKDGSSSFGLFNVSTQNELEVEFKPNKFNEYFLDDGIYVDYLSHQEVKIKNHKVKISKPMYLTKK